MRFKQACLVGIAVLTLAGGAAIAQTDNQPDKDRTPQAQQDQLAPKQAPQDMRHEDERGQAGNPADQSRDHGVKGNPDEQQDDRDRDQDRDHMVLHGQEKVDIDNAVIHSESAPRVDHLNFTLRVGVAIPRTIRVVPVPMEVVRFYPQWSGFLYFVSGDQIVVVDPNSFTVVGVLEA